MRVIVISHLGKQELVWRKARTFSIETVLPFNIIIAISIKAISIDSQM